MPQDGHASQYKLGPAQSDFVDREAYCVTEHNTTVNTDTNNYVVSSQKQLPRS